MFADDLKLYSIVNSVKDCEILQENLNAVSRWCRLNRLSINVSKCCIVTYSRKLNTLAYPYKIDNIDLKREFTVKDLGVLFHCNFTFNNHIIETVQKSLKTYGFIYRNCKDFSNFATLNVLYTSLIRSRLEYAALIWYPIYITHIDLLESVQRKFLKYLSFLLDGTYPPRGFDHSSLLNRFSFNSLHTRRIFLVLKFLSNLLNGRIDCSCLLHHINFVVPRFSSRQSLTFYTSFNKSNALSRSPIFLMCDRFNAVSTNCDIHFSTHKDLFGCIVEKFGV